MVVVFTLDFHGLDSSYIVDSHSAVGTNFVIILYGIKQNEKSASTYQNHYLLTQANAYSIVILVVHIKYPHTWAH